MKVRNRQCLFPGALTEHVLSGAVMLLLHDNPTHNTVGVLTSFTGSWFLNMQGKAIFQTLSMVALLAHIREVKITRLTR